MNIIYICKVKKCFPWSGSPLNSLKFGELDAPAAATLLNFEDE